MSLCKHSGGSCNGKILQLPPSFQNRETYSSIYVTYFMDCALLLVLCCLVSSSIQCHSQIFRGSCTQVKLIKCLVDNIVVDISFNQVGGLCTLCFLEQVCSLVQLN